MGELRLYAFFTAHLARLLRVLSGSLTQRWRENRSFEIYNGSQKKSFEKCQNRGED